MRRAGRSRWRVLASAAALLAVALGVALAGAGCTPEPTTAVERSELELRVDGLDRRVLLTVPEAPEGERMPLLIALHGAGGAADRFDATTRFPQLAASTGFVLATPFGTGPGAQDLTWNAEACCGTAVADGVDDIAFLEALIDELVARHPVDPQRVHLAGFSNGGMLAYRAACEIGDRLAGIAVVGGSLVASDCGAPRAMPLLVMHGTADRIVPFEGGEPFTLPPREQEPWVNRSVAESVGFWTERNTCEGLGVPTNRGPVLRELWTGCRVALYTVRGGEHVWFGTPTASDLEREPPGTPSASTTIVEFFDLDRVDAARPG